MTKIEIYTTRFCPYCIRAKQLLTHKGVEYSEIRVDFNSKKRNEMTKRTEGRRSVPQIFINDEGIGGFDELWALEQAGLLDAKLK